MCQQHENTDDKKKFTCPNKGNCCKALNKAAQKKEVAKDAPPAEPDAPKP